MSGRKRKYSSGAQAMAVARPFRPPTYKRRRTSAPPFRPVRDRVGGYYGRFAGANAELKFKDVTVDDAIIAAGGVLTTSINLIAQGTGESERIGRKCVLKSIMWRGSLSIPPLELEGNPGDTERFRLIVYQDKQTNGAAATALGILEAVSVDDFRNLANSGRFNILWDHHMVLNYATLSHFAVNSFSMSEVRKNFSFMKKCNIPLEFDNTVGALTELRSNNIGLLIVSEGGTGALVSRVRLRFSDQG